MMKLKSKGQLQFLFTYIFLSLGGGIVAAQTASQFIFYNGTITGFFTHPQSAPSSCPTYYFGLLANSSIELGVNPPWDTNPFFFFIGHPGNAVQPSAGQACYDVFAGCTNDAIYNLDFSTAYDECFQNEALCPAGILSGGFEYAGLEIINLNASTITKLDSTGSDNEKGYGVAGDQSTFVGNGTVVPSFDFQRPKNYSLKDGCADTLHFEWNTTTPFTYAVNFTNATATAQFTLSAPNGSVSISFSGSRADDLLNPNDNVNPYDDGMYSAIALSASNSSIPHFTFANGTAILWQSFSNGEWGVTSSALSIVETLRVCETVLGMLMVITLVASL